MSLHFGVILILFSLKVFTNYPTIKTGISDQGYQDLDKIETEEDGACNVNNPLLFIEENRATICELLLERVPLNERSNRTVFCSFLQELCCKQLSIFD